ncbi:MAG: pitrilysin family protein [Gemmatimonadota bacterium]|nr:pitrilysin family protein [Gemmatimonadota bacterium]
MAIVLALVVAVPAAAQRADLEKVIRRTVLPNGLEVVAVENHGVPLVTLELVVRNGAFTQSPEFAGLAHLYEHMFFKANAKFPDPDETINRASQLGAVFNASTREELVNYYLTISSDSVAAGMDFLAAALLTPKFLADELAREREVVIGEYDQQESSPFFRFDQEMGRRLWGAEFSRKNTIGDREVIRGTTPAKMRAIKDLYYHPNNSLLIIAGDVDPTAVFALAERIFGAWPRGADPFVAAPVPPIPPLTKNVGYVHEEAVNAVTVQIQWHGPSVRKDEDATFVADVFSDLLNAPGSRFQKKLVDSGLWEGVIVNYYTLNNVGPITVSGQTSPERLRAALKALDVELREVLKTGYFNLEEMNAAKAQRAVSSAFEREKASAFAHTIGFWWSVSGLEYYMKYVDEMARRAPAQLQDYARKYIIDRPRVVGVLLAPEARRQLGLTDDELARWGVPSPRPAPVGPAKRPPSTASVAPGSRRIGGVR